MARPQILWILHAPLLNVYFVKTIVLAKDWFCQSRPFVVPRPGELSNTIIRYNKTRIDLTQAGVINLTGIHHKGEKLTASIAMVLTIRSSGSWELELRSPYRVYQVIIRSEKNKVL